VLFCEGRNPVKPLKALIADPARLKGQASSLCHMTKVGTVTFARPGAAFRTVPCSPCGSDALAAHQLREQPETHAARLGYQLAKPRYGIEPVVGDADRRHLPGYCAFTPRADERIVAPVTLAA
jgi:hypothetical protein